MQIFKPSELWKHGAPLMYKGWNVTDIGMSTRPDIGAGPRYFVVHWPTGCAKGFDYDAMKLLKFDHAELCRRRAKAIDDLVMHLNARFPEITLRICPAALKN